MRDLLIIALLFSIFAGFVLTVMFMLYLIRLDKGYSESKYITPTEAIRTGSKLTHADAG